MLRITISKSGQPANTINFDKREITIGRTPSNDVRIPEPGVSSSHARILYTDGSLTLIDLDSTNGTFVNGTRIQGPQMVQPGDEVYVCSHKLAFELDGAGASGGAPSGPGAPLPVGVGAPPPTPGGAPLPVGVGGPPAPVGGPIPVGVGAPPVGGPIPVGVGAPPPPMDGPIPVGVGAPPAPPIPVGVGAPPPPMDGPPPPPGVGSPPPLAGPPPPIPGPDSAPPPIPGPAPRPDPSMPPPLGGPGPGGAPPALAVPSPAGVGGPVRAKAAGEPPTMPPMMPGPTPAPAPAAVAAPPSVPPPPSDAPPPISDGPAPLEAPASLPGPATMDSPPSLPDPAPMDAPPPLSSEPSPPSDEPTLDAPPPLAAPPPAAVAPEPPAPPPAPEPPPPEPAEPPGPPPPVAGPEPTPAPVPTSEGKGPSMPSPPPPTPHDSSKPQTPSTAAPGMAGKIESPTTGPDAPKAGPPKKVVIGSQSPVRTGATMMADALSREDFPAPGTAGAAAAASWVAPAVSASDPAPAPATPRPGALAGLDGDDKTTEACAQVFAAAVASLRDEPAMAEDALRAQLRNGLQDFAPHAPGLDVQGLAARIYDELRGRGPLGSLLADAQVHELALRGPAHATATRAGQQSPAEARFTSPDAMAWVLGHLTGQPFDASSPVLEGSTADGLRVSAVHHSIAAGGPVVRLRRASSATAAPTLTQLVASGTLSDPCAKLLTSAVNAGLRLLVVGGPGARTGPLLGALTSLMPADGTVVVRLGHDTVPAPAGATVLQSARAHAMPLLVDGALTLRPRRLVIEGIAGAEAGAATAALGRGLEGAIVHLQAPDCLSGLQRLGTLAASGVLGADPRTQVQAVAQVVDLVVALGRFGDGRTRVTQVAQPQRAPTSAPTSGPASAPSVIDLITLDPASRNWAPTPALAAFTNDLQSRGF